MWFDCKQPRAGAVIRVFCFPYAGGNGSVVFRNWEEKIPPFMEVHTLVLPGRGVRTGEAFQTDLLHVADLLAEQIKNINKQDPLPFIFVGYSLGALISFEVCRTLQGFDLCPVHCFLGGHIAPTYFDAESADEPKLYQLADKYFRRALKRYNMVSPALLEEKEFADMFLPIIRNDLELDETYIYRDLEKPLDANLTLFIGEKDVAAPQDQMLTWQELFATDDIKVKTFKDLGHEFLISKSEELREAVCKYTFTTYLTDPWPVRVVNKSLKTPDLTAISLLVDGEPVHTSMGDFVADAHALASWMYDSGVRPGDNVLLVAESSYSCFLSMLTLGLMNVVYVTCPPDMTHVDFQNRLKNCQPSLVLLCEELEILDEEQIATDDSGQEDESFEDLPRVVNFEDIDYKQWLGEGRYPNDVLYEDIQLTDVCFIAHTSGSTGLPKPIPLKHSNILNNLHWRSYSFPMAGNDDCYGISIFWFWYFMLPMMNDYRIASLPASEMLNLEVYLEDMAKLNVTHIEISPTYAGLMAKVGRNHRALKALSLCVLMGEVVHLETVRMFKEQAPNCRMTNIFSLSETNDITACVLDMKFLNHMEIYFPDMSAAPIGTPAWNVNIYLERQDKEILPLDYVLENADGVECCEMFIGCDGLLAIDGYQNNPAANEKAIIPATDGTRVFKCNDLVTVLQPDPVILVVTGRADRTVNVRGARVGLDRVSGIIKKRDVVKDCTVIWNFDSQQLVCFVVLISGDKEDLSILRQQLEGMLTPAETPSRFIVLDALPLNNRTKVDVKKLKQMLEDELKAKQRELSDDPIVAHVEKTWIELLNNQSFSITDDFFNVGGHSLLAVQLASALGLPVPDIMDKRTVIEQATLLRLRGMRSATTIGDFILEAPKRDHDIRIAVVGLAGRWPNSQNRHDFWNQIVNKEDLLVTLTDNELLKAGVPKELFSRPDWVRRGAIIPPEQVECFDANLFGMSEREARFIDPNQRVMLEMCFEALEDAGHGPFNAGKCGVFANGAALPTYLQNCLKYEIGDVSMVQLTDPGAYVQLELGNDKDYVPTRVSYCLNLTGPSKNVQSACSSGLIAVSEAVEALRAGRCDSALAGGVCIMSPQKTGYLYQEGMVFSQDGKVRPFDASANGTMFTNGGTVVMLKRLEDAIADRNHIYSVIHGIADNNDGHRAKKAYTAPSVPGQSECIASAYNDANIHPSQVSYIECHGTGTLVGDPIEIEGLMKVFGALDNKIPIGSLKANMGHANSAAGICSFGKLQMMFENETICPQLNFESPNPGLNFKKLPFVIPEQAQEWEPIDGELRIAGISSFGMGGTNCHAVCQEFPQDLTSFDLPATVVNVSAKTKKSLKAMRQKLTQYLEFHDGLNMGDVSFTLDCGRTTFDHRISISATSREDLLSKLATAKVTTVSDEKPKVILVCPGQGSQYAECGKDLYENFPIARNIVDNAIEILGYDFREEDLGTTRITQVTIFVWAYVTGIIMRELGVEFAAALGHSVGEVVAATLSGLMTFESGLQLIDIRGGLMDQMAEGSMCMVATTEDQVRLRLDDYPDVVVACVNGPELIVLSGPTEAIKEISQAFVDSGVNSKVLNTAAAFHSPAVTTEMLNELAAYVETVEFLEPMIDLLSNVTGGWSRTDDVQNAEYWATHMRRTVRWADEIETLKMSFGSNKVVFLECGPGKSACSMIKRCDVKDFDWHFSNTMRHPKNTANDVTRLMTCISELWTLGVNINFDALFTAEFGLGETRRVSLPTYAFDRKHCWVGPSDMTESTEVIYSTQTEALEMSDFEEQTNIAVTFGDVSDDLPVQAVPVNQLKELRFDTLWFIGGETDASVNEVSAFYLELIQELMGRESPLTLAIMVPKSLKYSGVYGMSKVVCLENSMISVKLMQTDGSVFPNIDDLTGMEFEIKDGLVYTKKLQKAKLPKEPAAIDSDSYYVITGGTRGLGLGLAKHLVNNHGVKKLVLIGRSEPAGQNLNDIEALQGAGTEIEVFRCDITTRDYELPHREEVAGVFHCAGVLRDGLIMNAGLDDLNLVFDVKTSVEFILSQCENLQFTLLFSSTSALFGAGGQVTYSGANTYLDWLSDDSRSYSVYSVQWAGWKEIGMSVDTELKELSGERHISPSVGYQALDNILALPGGMYSVMDIVSWDEFAQNSSVFPSESHVALVSNLLTQQGSTTRKKKAKATDVRSFVCDTLGGQQDTSCSLYTLGYDSLDIVNFRNRVQAAFTVSIPLAKYLDENLTIESLIQELDALLPPRS